MLIWWRHARPWWFCLSLCICVNVFFYFALLDFFLRLIAFTIALVQIFLILLENATHIYYLNFHHILVLKWATDQKGQKINNQFFLHLSFFLSFFLYFFLSLILSFFASFFIYFFASLLLSFLYNLLFYFFLFLQCGAPPPRPCCIDTGWVVL